MTIETLKKLIELAGGPAYVMGFRFANGYKVIYSTSGHLVDVEKDFMVVNGVEMMTYEHYQDGRVALISYLEVEEIVQLYVLPDLEHDVILRPLLD